MNKLLEYNNCFVCGKDSKNGLKVDFEVTGSGARAFFTPGDNFEGFKGIVHGGVITALLDEIMWKAINGQTGVVAMTVKIEVRFKKPALVGTTFLVEGSIAGRRKRIFEARGQITDSEGEVVAEATGIFMEMDAKNSELLRATLK